VNLAAKTASIFLVGAGRMGGALLRGWLTSGFEEHNLAVREPHPSREIATLLADLRIADAPRNAPDVIVLAVKPQIMTQVLTEVAADIGPETAVLSIAAGRTIASIAGQVPQNTGVVRAMPNLPAEAGRGIAALCANASVTPNQRDLCESLLRAVGEVVWIDDESLMDAITAVSGSGPAYVLYLVESLAKAAQEAGLPEQLAMKLARATVTGAGELLYRSALEPAELRQNVTSPGGTTAAGLSILMHEQGLAAIIGEAVTAAAKRSRELSE
jgi:pyrroline-5-carboxylate reductase